MEGNPTTSPQLSKQGVGLSWGVQGSIIARKLAKLGPPSNIAKALPIVMKLDPQGPPVSYADGASKLPQKKGVTEDTMCMCNVCMKDTLQDKEKVAAQAILDHITQQEWDEEATQKKEQGWRSKICQHEIQWRLAKEGAERQVEYNQQHTASGACPDHVTDPLGWCKYMWAKQDRYKAPKWASNLCSASPMDHKQLATCVVCLWGMFIAYQQTCQNV